MSKLRRNRRAQWRSRQLGLSEMGGVAFKQGTGLVKPVVTIAALATLAMAWSGPARAQYAGSDLPPLRGVLPPYEIMTSVRSMGFIPVGRPILRGRAYAVRAIDEDDLPVRVVLDAYTGRVMTVRDDIAMWPGSRFGALYAPAFRYGEYAPVPPASIPHVRRLPPRSAAVTPVPRERPANASAPLTTGSTGAVTSTAASPSAAPVAQSSGHSVPAPVSGRTKAATAGAVAAPATKADAPASASVAAAKPMVLVPVAPLD